MNYQVKNFRHGLSILEHDTHRDEWHELITSLRSIGRDELINQHLEIAKRQLDINKRPPVGLQTALNEAIRIRLQNQLDWIGQPSLFPSDNPDLAEWTMDFLKNAVGVEIAFNNASYFPWIFTRLNLAGESQLVIADHVIEVGVTVCASADLKAWGRMDPSVGVFGKVALWLEMMRPIMPTPMALMGLNSEGLGDPPPVFGRDWWNSPGAQSYLQ